MNFVTDETRRAFDRISYLDDKTQNAHLRQIVVGLEERLAMERNEKDQIIND